MLAEEVNVDRILTRFACMTVSLLQVGAQILYLVRKADFGSTCRQDNSRNCALTYLVCTRRICLGQVRYIVRTH